MEYIDFNLNYLIKVKLTRQGMEFWRIWDIGTQEATKLVFPDYKGEVKPIQHYLDKADAEGYVEMQAWSFIRIFGPVSKLGGSYYSSYIKLSREGFVNGLPV